MKYILLDAQSRVSPEQLHTMLAQQLALPAYYGRNLDALYDCLTERREDTVISVIHSEDADAYLQKMLRVLRDSAKENPHIFLNMI